MGRQKMMDTLAPVLPSTAKHLHQGATEMKAGNQERDVYIMYIYIYMYIKVIKLYIYIYIMQNMVWIPHTSFRPLFWVCV